MKRRNFVKGIFASAAVITTGGVLMPVREIIKPQGFKLSPSVTIVEYDVSRFIPHEERNIFFDGRNHKFYKWENNHWKIILV